MEIDFHRYNLGNLGGKKVCPSPLEPKRHPGEGSFTQAKALIFRWAPKAWASPRVVVRFPSPNGVEVILVTVTKLKHYFFLSNCSMTELKMDVNAVWDPRLMKCCKIPFGACEKLLHYKIMLMHIIIFQDASYPVTITYFPSGCFSMRFRASSRILALLLPYGSTSSENKPTSLASWPIGLLWHEQEMSASLRKCNRHSHGSARVTKVSLYRICFN